MAGVKVKNHLTNINAGFKTKMEAYILLKYRNINKRLIESLVQSQIYFARPGNLNDPFDCQVDILKSLENAISQSADQQKETLNKLLNDEDLRREFEKAQKDIMNAGVFSSVLSDQNLRNLDNPLMWSHYANSHKKICLVYAIPKCFIEDRSKNFYGIAGVHYCSNPLVSFFKQLASNWFKFKEPFTDIIKKVLTIKDACWSYEKEMRILRKAEGNVSIDQSYLKRVCFGLNTPDNDIKLIKKIIKSINYSSVGYAKMKRKKDSDFGIIAVEMN